MRRMLRAAAAVTMAALAVVLAGCAGLPASGPVFAGLPPGAAAPPDFSFIAQKPQDGASPEQIVQGFIDAGIGPEGNWAVAQLYLAPTFRSTWNPIANTTIDDRAAREYVADGDDKVTLTVTQRASVDGTGAYKPTEGGRTPLQFALDKVDGQWRITKAPDGIVIGADQFTSVFHQYPLMYFSPGWRYLVPDVRWFPANNAATRITQQLVDGKPSPWLAESVTSAFPDNLSLDTPSVPVTGGVAQVELSGPVLSVESATLGRMQAQLARSLSNAGVTGVSMSYGGAGLNAETAAVASTRIEARALAGTDKGFGFLSSDGTIEPIGGITEAMRRIEPVAVDLAADYSAAAVRTSSGAVARVPAKGAILSLDGRADLVDPAIDSRGFVWSVPADAPDGLRAYNPEGHPVSVAGGAFANASHVTAIAVSRDGTRLAAILTVGGQPQVVVFGIVRDADGVPKSLGEAVSLAPLPGRGIDVTWLDDSALGVLATSGGATVEIRQLVGGPSTSTSAPDKVTTIAGSSGTTVRLRGGDGTLYSQRGSNWEQAGDGILVLGTVQGMPQG